MKIKLLTGEHIYQSYANHHMAHRQWDEILPATRAIYDDIAKQLNEDLGLCDTCGNRPDDGLLEIAGERWRAARSTPPVNEKDPKIQLMHMVFNASREPVGVIVAPAGMSLEDFKAQLTEEMKYIRFLLHLNHHQTIKAETISELYALINTHVTPTYLGRIPYYIHVYRKDDVIGYGSYVRSTTRTDVTTESGAAEGLNDALQEYGYNQTAQEAHDDGK